MLSEAPGLSNRGERHPSPDSGQSAGNPMVGLPADYFGVCVVPPRP